MAETTPYGFFFDDRSTTSLQLLTRLRRSFGGEDRTVKALKLQLKSSPCVVIKTLADAHCFSDLVEGEKWTGRVILYINERKNLDDMEETTSVILGCLAALTGFKILVYLPKTAAGPLDLPAYPPGPPYFPKGYRIPFRPPKSVGGGGGGGSAVAVPPVGQHYAETMETFWNATNPLRAPEDAADAPGPSQGSGQKRKR